MRHVRPLSKRPAPAQFESLLQFIGLISALIGLVPQLEQVLASLDRIGMRKDDEDAA